MATNARGHTVPAAGETPSRAAIFGSLLTVNDIIPVSNETARAQKLAELAAVGVSGHLLVYREDLRIIERRTASGWQSVTGEVTGVTPVPAFSLPQATPPVTILNSTTLTHPFSGEVIVEAELVGDVIVGASTSVRFLLTVAGLARPGWAQNFSAGGNVRDSPHTRVRTTVSAGTPVTVQVAAADVGVGGTSNGAGVLSVAWTIRPGRGAA